MKQTDSDKIREGQEILAVLKEQRGGAILPIHKKMANDPKLLQAFSQQFKICKQEISHIPPQYMELMLMMMGAAAGNAVTIREHGQLALKKGATPDEVGEAHALIEQHGDRDGRIDVAAGDIPDRVGHSDDREPERQRGRSAALRRYGRRFRSHPGFRCQRLQLLRPRCLHLLRRGNGNVCKASE